MPEVPDSFYKLSIYVFDPSLPSEEDERSEGISSSWFIESGFGCRLQQLLLLSLQALHIPQPPQ